MHDLAPRTAQALPPRKGTRSPACGHASVGRSAALGSVKAGRIGEVDRADACVGAVLPTVPGDTRFEISGLRLVAPQRQGLAEVLLLTSAVGRRGRQEKGHGFGAGQYFSPISMAGATRRQSRLRGLPLA
ncbi:hypothetical protein Krad_2301 [Kineococcus radiotolerans SRS30216 = ATCC BAA-149]|uniref:Uncharacterized protein n=1 Tax=Kineococcus radiotolerans (strain ATCC BAA-149 / DSM 14245 / SRS30216) TaxID=266940 RepID=A6WAE3_KINRD|nr:hypothetical protein Krad_2301 [Kineococcus radiotolerans SRS30216 = ATCC BAA-149]